MERLRILSAQSKYLTSLNTSGHLHMAIAVWAAISLLHHANISYYYILEIPLWIYINVMEILFVSTSTSIVHFHNSMVYNNLGAFLDANRAHKARTAANGTNSIILSHTQLQSTLHQINNLYVIDLVVTTNKAQYHFVSICLESYSLNALFHRQAKIFSHHFNSGTIRSILFLQRQDFLLSSLDNLQLCLFITGCIVAGITISNAGLTSLSQNGKLMGMTAANSAVISLNRAEIQAHTSVDIGISVIHLLVGLIHTLFILIKGIEILHNKLSAPHQAKARTNLITVFVLNLIQHQRKLLVGANLIPDQSSNHFLMGRA